MKRLWKLSLVGLSACFLVFTALGQPPRPRDGDPPPKPPTDQPKPPVDQPKPPTGDGPARPSDEAVPGLGPVGPSEKVHTGCMFTEGPAADKEGNVYFSDVPASRTYKIDLAAGKTTLLREQTRRGNGMMFNAKGELVVCEGDGALVVCTPDGQRRNVLVESYLGKPLNGPNDLVIDKLGGIYFTDPYFGRPENAKQEKQGVYYITASSDVARIIDDLTLPNGLILSPDEKHLYVISSAQPRVMRYPVNGPGRLGPAEVFCVLQRPNNRHPGGGDGCTVDEKGNLYIATAIGVQVYSNEGKLLGTIRVPENPSNCTFGGKDFKTLYVTARHSVYAYPMSVAGHRFATGK